MAVFIPMAGSIAVTWFEAWDVRFQTRHQRSSTATLSRFRQQAPRVGAGQLATSIGCILARQELRIGQQLIDLAVAKDPLERNCCSVGGGTGESSLVQRTQRLDIITGASGAQRKLCCQLLRIGQPGAGVLLALVSLVLVRLVIVTVALHVRRSCSVRLARDGVDQTLSD